MGRFDKQANFLRFIQLHYSRRSIWQHTWESIYCRLAPLRWYWSQRPAALIM